MSKQLSDYAFINDYISKIRMLINPPITSNAYKDSKYAVFIRNIDYMMTSITSDDINHCKQLAYGYAYDLINNDENRDVFNYYIEDVVNMTNENPDYNSFIMHAAIKNIIKNETIGCVHDELQNVNDNVSRFSDIIVNSLDDYPNEYCYELYKLLIG